MPEPEKVEASSQPFATGMQQQSYKGLLNQQAQKLRKQFPVYQTLNEGSVHEPKFRTTVWVDGEKYTSPNTFQYPKMAENDASRITLFALLVNLKNEALHHVCEDKKHCKSILVEYAVKMNIEKPTYDTVQLGGSPVPVFRSSLVFNGVSYTGDECRAKKETEQSAARVVVLKYLDSETGNMLSKIVKSKFNHHVTKDTQNDTNEAKSDERTKIPYTESLQTTTTTNTPAINPPLDITQTHAPQILSTPTIPVLTQTPFPETTNNVPTYSPPSILDPPLHVTHTHIPQPLTQQTPAQIISVPTPLTQPTGTNNAPPSVHVTQTHVPQISTQVLLTQSTPEPLVQTPFVGTNTAPSVMYLEGRYKQRTCFCLCMYD